jgi:hypothetical protein
MVARSDQGLTPLIEQVSFIVLKERYECRLSLLKPEGASTNLHKLLSKGQLAVEVAHRFAPSLLLYTLPAYEPRAFKVNPRRECDPFLRDRARTSYG